VNCLSAIVLFLAAGAALGGEVDAARKRWSESPLGPTLERILPPGMEPAALPESASAGAKLTVRYCVQCHNLPSPAMHHAAKWQPIVDRMIVRMHGKGNLGKVMAEMMAGVDAPSADAARTLVAYLRKHAQLPLDPKKVPEVNARSAEPFRLACQQCHILPDPQRYTAKDWPAVVARMERNMEWMNRVVGSKPVPGEPQLRIEDINAFLVRNSRRTSHGR
jgi:cytochrome c5